MLFAKPIASRPAKTRKASTARKRRPTERRLARPFESLEARQMMAADTSQLAFLETSPADDVAAWVAGPVAGTATDSGTESADMPSLNEPSTLSPFAAILVDQMTTMAEQTGQIVLDQIDQFASFAGIVIEAPTIASDGSVTGTTTFGNANAPILFQYVGQPETGVQDGSWVLSVKTDLGNLIDDGGLIDSPIELRSPIVVFSPVSVDMDASAMSDQASAFYGELYGTEDFTVRLQRGVNVLTTATIAEESVPANLLEKVGVSVPQIQIEGVLLSDFTDDTVEQWKTEIDETGFWTELREGVMLRATLPQIVIDDLPANLVVGDALLVWQSPGTDHDQIYVSVDLEMMQTDGSIVELTGRLGIADTPTGTEYRLSATASGIRDAFGVTGLDLDEVKLLIALSTVKATDAPEVAKSPAAVPSVSVGVLADMEIGGRHVSIAGRVDFNLVAGTPIKIALRGELESMSSTDLMNFAKRLTGLGEVSTDPTKTPAFEIRDVVINIAPLGGDAELGIEDGIGVQGELYIKGTLAGRVDGMIDRTGLVPEIRLAAWTRAFELGALSVTDVTVDILMSESSNDHFIVKGGIELFGISHTVDIHLSSTRMHYQVTTEVDGLGMVDYFFEASVEGIPHWTYRAVVRNELSSTLEGKVADDLNAWVKNAREDFDHAQAKLDAAQNVVNGLIAERDAAMFEAQAQYDKIESDLAKAEAAVASLSSKVAGLRRLESSRYSSWRSAVRSTQQAKWYQYPGRKANEVAKYTSYRSTQGLRIAAQGSLNVANATMAAVRISAGWVLDAAGPEAHPEVIRLNAELKIKTAALDIAKFAVEAAETVSTGAVQALAFAAEHHDDLFMIDQIRFEGTLSAVLTDNAVDFQIDYTFMNQAETDGFTLAVSDFDLDSIAKKMISDVRAKLTS